MSVLNQIRRRELMQDRASHNMIAVPRPLQAKLHAGPVRMWSTVRIAWLMGQLGRVMTRFVLS